MGAEPGPGSRIITAHPTLRWWTWPVVVTALFLILQPVIGSGWAMFPDSYRYAKQVELNLGSSPAEANTAALTAFCQTTTSQRTWTGRWEPLVQSEADHARRAAQCLARHRGVQDLTTTDPRFLQIFTTRPGYPLVATPFAAVFGLVDGLRAAGYVIACAGGLIAYAALRLARLRATAAAAGQAAFLVSPLGWWALQPLGEGMVSVCVLGAVAGILALRRHSLRLGMCLIAGSWLALAAVRYSTLVLIAAALAAACLGMALTIDRVDRRRRRAMVGAAVLGGAATAATMLAMPLFGLPGSSVTLQDTFTRHFADPLVPDPWYRLAAANYHFWPQWLGTPSESWLLIAVTAAGLAALVAWRRDLLWLALALLATGVAHVAAHPLPSEAERLGLLMWMPAVLGLAVAIQAVTRRVHVDMTLSLDGPTGNEEPADRDAHPVRHHR